MLTESQRERVASLAAEALNLAEAERERLLGRCEDEAVAREVRQLLDHDRSSDFLEAPAIDQLPEAEPPSQIGPYRLLERLGEGGFGEVWLAEQTMPIHRRVALKLIRSGMDSRQVLARFGAERQALAMMNHAGIARALNAGVAEDGRPYFVMELVQGEPITTHCDREELPIRQRLELFVQVCSAVQHAHQKGVIHRDLKPSNILVTTVDGRPVPKVIDFGIAKAITGRLTDMTVATAGRQLLGTPAYMSPEQAESSAADIDTRADIYALGVLLYELMTGTTPFDAARLRSASFGEVQRIICGEEPPRPSIRVQMLMRAEDGVEPQATESGPPDAQAGRRDPKRASAATVIARCRGADPRRLGVLLRRDLDWIVMKCIEKDRSRRYETANALAMDVNRHLMQQPVVAGPPSRIYRARKFVRRNRGGVLAAGLVAAALILGVIGTSVGLARALEAGAEAKRQAAEKEHVAELQARMFDDIDVELMGARLREDILSEAEQVWRRARHDPEEIAERIDRLESLLAGLNFTNAAVRTVDRGVLERGLEAAAGYSDDPLVRASLLENLAEALNELGLYERARPPLAEALMIRRELLGNDDPITLTSVANMGSLLLSLGRLDDAEPYYREALESRRRILGDDHPDALTSINNMGYLLQSRGKLKDAEPYFREALETRRRVLGDDHPDTLGSMNNMASLLQNQGKLKESEAYHRRALEARRRVHGDDHPATLRSIGNLGYILRARGKLVEAEPYYREALEASRRILGDEHPDTLIAVNQMGTLLLAAGRLEEAETCFRQALEARRRILGDDHPDTLVSVVSLGALLFSQGKLEKAEPFVGESLEAHRRIFGDEHPRTIICIGNMGSLLHLQGKLDQAEPYRRESLETQQRVLGHEHPQTLISMSNMAVLLRDQGKLNEAADLHAKTVEIARRIIPDRAETGNFLGHYARTLTDLERFAEAEKRALEGYAILETALPPEHAWRAGAIKDIVRLYEAWHAAEPGAGHDARADEWRTLLPAPEAPAASGGEGTDG